jgi:hypothetical protein
MGCHPIPINLRGFPAKTSICPMRRPRHLAAGLNNNTRDFTELLVIDVAPDTCVFWVDYPLSRVVRRDSMIA